MIFVPYFKQHTYFPVVGSSMLSGQICLFSGHPFNVYVFYILKATFKARIFRR